MKEKRGLEDVVAELPLFQGLEPRYLELVTGFASNVRFNEGDMVFREGEMADTFFAIRRGKVAIEIHVPRRRALTIQTLGEGDVLSWSWLFPPYETQFDARCLTLVRALAFDGACLRAKCEEDPCLGFEFMKRFSRLMAERLRATRHQVLNIYGDSVRT